MVGGPSRSSLSSLALADSFPDALVAATAEGRIVLFNKAAESLYGYSAEEVVGQLVALLAFPSVPDELSEAVASVCQGAHPARLQLRQRKKDGSGLTTSVVVRRWGDGALEHGATVIARPFVALDEVMTPSLASLTEHGVSSRSRDGLFLLEVTEDGGFRTVDVSPAFERLVGMSREELVGKSVDAAVPRAVAEKVLAKFRACVDQGVPSEYEFELTLPVGTRAFHSTLLPLRDGAGRVHQIVGFTRDVTETQRAEAAAGFAELRYREVFERAGDALGVFGPRADGRYCVVDVNPEYERLGGISRAQLVGTSAFDVLPAQEAELVEARIRACLEGGRAIEFDERRGVPFLNPVQERIYHTTLSPLGEGPRVLSASRDVTVARRTEAELKASEARFSLAFRNGPLAMAIMRAGDLSFVDVNDAFVKASGYTRDELLGHTAEELKLYPSPEERAPLLAELEHFGSLAPFEFVSRKKSGEVVVAEAATAEITLGGEKHYLSMVVDVTERKRAEEALRKLSRAVEQSPVSIVITNREGLIEYANPRFSQVTGYSVEEVRGKNPRIFKSGETPAQAYSALWHTISSGLEWRGEFHNRKKNGELYWEAASISPIFDGSGVITHFVAVKEDVTETKRLQQELLQAQKMKAFAQLAAGIAHDFNNLLTVIQGNLSVVTAGELSSDQAEAIGDVGRAAKRAAELTRQLLTFSRRKAPTLRLVELGDVVGEVVKTLQRLLGEQVEVKVHTAKPAQVRADRSMLEQVLVNLTLNSRDAMLKGGRLEVMVEPVKVDAEQVRKTPRARQGDFVRLTVRDNGTGIPSAALSRLFEPFFTTKELGKGTGLGLATVFGIVEQHQGWVTVESEVGEGTSVHVFLPRAKEEAPKRPSGALILEPKGGGMILVVEDEPAVRAMVVRTLSQAGYEVREAASATEAHSIWEREIEHVVLVVADVVMPGGVSGHQIAERMRRRKPGLHVLYVSGYADEAMREELGKSALFLEKPFTPDELLRRVRLCLPALGRSFEEG